MKVRSAITGLMGIAACLLISVQLDAQETKKTTEARSNMTAYLGIAVEPLQPVLAKQLPDLRAGSSSLKWPRDRLRTRRASRLMTSCSVTMNTSSMLPNSL